jgi:hypothetical protein
VRPRAARVRRLASRRARQTKGAWAARRVRTVDGQQRNNRPPRTTPSYIYVISRLRSSSSSSSISSHHSSSRRSCRCSNKPAAAAMNDLEAGVTAAKKAITPLGDDEMPMFALPSPDNPQAAVEEELLLNATAPHTRIGTAHANVQQRDYQDDATRLPGVVMVAGAIDTPTPLLASRPEEQAQLLVEAGGDRGRNKEDNEKGGGKELVTTPPCANEHNVDATEPSTSIQNDTGRRYWVAAGAAWWPSMRDVTESIESDYIWMAIGLVVTPQVVCAAAILVGESLAVNWVVVGLLAIAKCLFVPDRITSCVRDFLCPCVIAQRVSQIVAAKVRLGTRVMRFLPLLMLAAHGTLMLTVAGWASVIFCTGLAGMGYVGGLVVLVWERCKQGKWDSQRVIIFALTLWIAALTVVPAVLFTWAGFATSNRAKSALGACGVFVFITALWMLGWAFLWYRGEKLEPIAGNERLAALPPVTLQRLKLFTVLSECYNYCGFSYFPALPWRAMAVPPKVPHPQMMMLAGFFYFDDVDTHFWIFLGASVMVVLSFVLLGLTVWFNKPQRQDLVVQIFFDLLSFPLIKQLCSVFSCTSASVWIESKDKLSGTIEVVRFCDTGTVSMDMQCMDSDPSLQCWESQHRSYIVAVLTLLVPYYVAALELQRSAQARQTVVRIDGGWLVVTIQSKFLLAVIASSFGECFPIVSTACHASIRRKPPLNS